MMAMSVLGVALGFGGGSFETGDIYLALETIEHTDEEREEHAWLLACLENGYPLTPAMESRLSALQDESLWLFEAAAVRDYPAWLVNWEDEGFAATLPHIGLMMQASRMAFGRGEAAAARGDAEALADDVNRCLTAASHVRAEPCLIASLTSIGITRRAVEVARSAAERGLLTPDAAASMATALRRAGAAQVFDRTGDAFGIGAAIAQERAVIRHWMAKQLELHEGADEDPIAQQAVDAVSDVLPDIGTLGLTKGMARAELAQLDAWYGEYVRIARLTNHTAAARRIAALENTIGRSKATFAASLLPSMSGILSKRQETLDEIADVAASLDAIAQGTAPRSTNAAWWWIRAGGLAGQCDGPWTADPDTAAAVDDLLAIADAIPTAAYPPVIDGYIEPLIPWWLADQDVLLAGLLDRAERGLDAGDAAGELERLIRMTAALGNNGSMAASRTGHSVLAAITPLVEQCAPTLTPAQRARLEQWIRTISTRDPLGVQSAAAATRRRLEGLVPHDFGPALARDIPADDAGLLSMIAWLRGRADAARNPRIFIAPGGTPQDAPLTHLDALRLGAWAEVGASNERPAGFAELGGEDHAATSTSAAALLNRVRSATRRQ